VTSARDENKVGHWIAESGSGVAGTISVAAGGTVRTQFRVAARSFVPSVVVVVLSLAAVAQDIQHAPVPQSIQCRADATAWVKADAVHKATYRTLELESAEFVACDDSDRDYRLLYRNALMVIQAEYKHRLLDFLNRHGMLDAFVAEDEGGKR